jgi:hypothetical protein
MMKRLMVFLCFVFLVFSISGSALAAYTLYGDAVFTSDAPGLSGLYWMVDSNYAQNSGFSSAGTVNFNEANTLAQQLQNSAYYGFDDWRLPTNPESYTLFGSTDNGLNPVPFSGFRLSPYGYPPYLYWTSTPYMDGEHIAIGLILNNGSFYYDVYPMPDSFKMYAIFVSNGHQVPIPSAVWLLGSSLIGLVGLRRKLKK